MYKKFKGNQIERDINSQSVISTRTTVLPIRNVSNVPSVIPGFGGGLIFDTITKRPYYNDGLVWLPLTSGGVSSSTESFGFIKFADQNIPPLTDTVITGWSTIGSTSYQTIANWNLATGVYTATLPEKVFVDVTATWESGITNQGTRVLSLEYSSFPSPLWDVVASVQSQAHPDAQISTAQNVHMNFNLNVGDRIRVVVSQNSVFDLVISGGNETFLNGFRIFSI